nr:PREDICTED: Fanconi anemia group M protein homolog [Linepithema humile]
MELSSQSTGISNDSTTKGFDLSSGNTWIYPENYPVREYQFNIVKSVLYRNTLVCLPTGLGKTFIAAVVMYNFWRWYPYGKIVFLAPTKPLVAQQIDACYEVMGIPSIDMMELTGAINQKNREIAWSKKRIIFATPQVFHNDLERSIVPSHLVKCVVVDEAHKALGKHSYCECIRILSTQNQYFRILALSATPGNKLDNVHEVIQNLHISHLELREENSIDIMPYINKRKVDIILVPLSNELATFKEKYVVIMDRHVRFLMQYNILRGYTANISKGRIFHLLKEFKTKTDKSGNYAQIMKTLNILLTMYHAYELMIRHGLRAFCKFYRTHSDKFWMNSENHLQDLLHEIETYLGPFPNIHPNGDVSEIPADLIFGHNKFHKLKELLENHFKTNSSNQKDTRAIVFVEYRDIVNEVYILLLQSKPVIRPQMFVGQASQKQKQQIKALEDFRNNHVNVLISTSIGEEGLDVGEVDLIICFDVSQHSPIRLVQRMGRTGRKRDGHIIVLVTDGKEHENLKSTLSRRDSLNNKILNTSNIFPSMYENNPRMIPKQFIPECHKIHIVALPKTPNVKGRKKKKIINKKNEASSTKQTENSPSKKDAGQPSMIKFLTNSKCKDQNRNNTPAKYSKCDIFTQLITQSNTHLRNTINPNNVKLLSDDNAGIDFLTLCAVKKSEEEMSCETVCKMDTTYVPQRKPIKDLYNFIVPDIEVIDNLSFLTKFTDILQVQNTNFEDDIQIIEDDATRCENGNDKSVNNNDYVNINDDSFWCTIQNRRNIDNDEIRFEDILDESSDSNKTEILHLNKKIADTEINPIEVDECFASNMGDDNAIMTDTRTKLSIDTLHLEPSIFENILNESFSSIEDIFEDKDKTIRNTISPDFSNVFAKNEERTTHASTVSILYDEDNVVKPNQDLSVPTEFTTQRSNHLDKFAKNFADELQDFDFNSDDDISEFVKHKSNKKNTSVHNSKAEESLLSITQAIGEIAQMKRNVAKSPRLSVSKKIEDDDDAGWISVDIKCETQKQKFGNRNTNSKIKLSNIKRNYTAKSCTFEQNFELLDNSDEDFRITEDNARKFDELESSYFRNTSKESEDGSSCLPSTSRKYTKINSFVDISNNMKLCGMSTPIHKRPGLSLKRNKSQSDVIDFKVPSRCMNNTRDKNILESSSSTSKQMMPPLDRKIAQKNRHKRNDMKNKFINDEAEVDCDFVSSDESIDDDDENLADFVSYTQYSQDQVDMHAHYLQTIRSPIKRPGVFHFSKPQSTDPNVEILSLSTSLSQDSYVNDSFCVAEDAEPSILDHNDSILERAEKELERNRRKRLCFDKNMKRTKKKKTNILNQSVSSEDDIEQLRIQVQEN